MQTETNRLRLTPTSGGRGWRALAAVAVLLANVASANPHYDSSATAGGLQTVCKGFSIDKFDVVGASCNKVTLGVVSLTSASIKVQRKEGSACGQDQSITPEADRVVLKYKCTITGDTVHERDLNDMFRWNATAGKLEYKTSA